MKLKEFLENINQLTKEDPSILELEVITSRDDEGNEYSGVWYTPATGHWSEDDQFIPTESEDFDPTQHTRNTICIN